MVDINTFLLMILYLFGAILLVCLIILSIKLINTITRVNGILDEVDNKMAKLDSFTIEGYIISLKSEKETTTFNVLNKEHFDEAINSFILSFVSPEEMLYLYSTTQCTSSRVGSNWSTTGYLLGNALKS